MNLVYFNDLTVSLLLLHPSPCTVYHGLTAHSNTDWTLNILVEKVGRRQVRSPLASSWNL